MSDTDAIAEAVDGFLADPRTLRIQRDAELVADLALGGFEAGALARSKIAWFAGVVAK